jgi:hypothetical protein
LLRTAEAHTLFLEDGEGSPRRRFVGTLDKPDGKTSAEYGSSGESEGTKG